MNNKFENYNIDLGKRLAMLYKGQGSIIIEKSEHGWWVSDTYSAFDLSKRQFKGFMSKLTSYKELEWIKDQLHTGDLASDDLQVTIDLLNSTVREGRSVIELITGSLPANAEANAELLDSIEISDDMYEQGDPAHFRNIKTSRIITSVDHDYYSEFLDYHVKYLENELYQEKPLTPVFIISDGGCVGLVMPINRN